MTRGQRVALAVGIVILDAAVVVVPLGTLFIAYVLVTKPKWVRDWLERAYTSA